jgi:hypothetical protein
VDDALTVLLPAPPSDVNDREVGVIDDVQLGAAWVTVKVLPPRVSVPVRVVFPLLGATLKATPPVPVPLAPPVMVIQEALLLASHEQPAAVVTVLLPAPPSASNAWLTGETLYEQLVPDCVTLKVVPAIVSVPDRFGAAGLAATLKDAVPLPVPLAPPVTVIHEALLAAVHTHPAPAVTVLLPVPAAAENARLVGEIEYAHAPACVTLKVVPAIVSVPDRFVVAVFAATLNDAVPLPVPLAPPVTVIHDALLAAVHAHPAPAVTVLLPVPAAAGNA